MRFPLCTNIGVLLIALAMPHASYAAGNVLVPSAPGNGTASLPNLGLGAPDAAPTQTPPTAPSPPPPAIAVPPTNLPQTPATTVPATPLITAITKEQAARLPPGAAPTTIIHQPDTTEIFAQLGKNLPYSLTLQIGTKSIFGAKDVQLITSKLGLSRDQIATSCSLGLNGILQTDKGSYVFNSGLAPQATVHYDGVIKNYLMAAVALCAVDPAKLPPGSGLLTETGNRFLFPLQQIKCAGANRQVSRLTITYDGSGNSSCNYD